MKLETLLKENVLPGQKLLVYFDLDTGTKEKFPVEVMRGARCHTWTDEYWQWLVALNLEIETVSAVCEDTQANKDMLCIKCKALRMD